MSSLKTNNIFNLINKLEKMKSMGAAPKDIEKLEDDIGDLQMNSVLGDIFEED